MKIFTRIHTGAYERRQLAAVRRQLHSPEREVQAETIYLLVSLRDTRGLRRALRHPSPWIRREALKGLTHLHGARAARWLVSSLTDPDRSVAHAAVECLEHVADLQILWALQRCVVSEDWLVRYHGTAGLARLSGRSPEVDRLLVELEQDEHAWVRNTATQALRRLTPHPCPGADVCK
jgi:HEAT repeat protein